MVVPFDVSDRDYDIYERMDFWESLRPWFLEQGYRLYRQEFSWMGEPREDVVATSPDFVPTENNPNVEHPYCCFGGDPPNHGLTPLRCSLNGRIVYAQDIQNRHVAMKLVKDGSHEYQILRLLSREPALSSSSSFDCVVPVLDFLYFDHHWFVVMPRWGILPLQPSISSISEVMDFMHYMLEGLLYLHRRLIAHRDIKVDNILVSHFALSQHMRNNNMRRLLRSQSKLVYCLYDFDLSVIFPPTPSERRLPARESFITGGCYAYDTYQGELDYDPFAHDIGAMGMLFCCEFQHLTRAVPMLAPLLDGMVTRDLSRRFTATGALRFFEDLRKGLTPAQLKAPVGTGLRLLPEDYDRWAGLPEEFVQRWSSFREPPLPRSTKILRAICKHEIGYKSVQCIRRLGRWTAGLGLGSMHVQVFNGRLASKMLQ